MRELTLAEMRFVSGGKSETPHEEKTRLLGPGPWTSGWVARAGAAIGAVVGGTIGSAAGPMGSRVGGAAGGFAGYALGEAAGGNGGAPDPSRYNPAGDYGG